MNTPIRPRECGNCTMFGHSSRHCHETSSKYILSRDVIIYDHWGRHCVINNKWIALQHQAGWILTDDDSPRRNSSVEIEEWVIKRKMHRQKSQSILSSNKPITKDSCDCPICMEPISDKNKFVTACGHTFCGTCILTNFQRNTSCPLCRGEIAPNVKFETATEKFNKVFSSDMLRDIIQECAGSTITRIDNAVLRICEKESNGEPLSGSIGMGLAQPIIRSLLIFSQELRHHVIENM